MKDFTFNRYQRRLRDRDKQSQDYYIVDHSSSEESKLLVDSRVVDRKGTWISFSFASDDPTREIRSVVFMSISFVFDYIKVNAKIFRIDGTWKYNFEGNTNSAFYLNNIYISYVLDGSSKGRADGFTHLQFDRDPYFGEIFRSAFSDVDSNKYMLSIGFKKEFEFSSLETNVIPKSLLSDIDKLKGKLKGGGQSMVLEYLNGPYMPDTKA